MEKPFKLVLAGVVAGVILFISASIAYHFAGKITDPSLSQIFRDVISMKWFYKLLLVNVGAGLIMALFYSTVSKALPGGTIMKGAFWGFIVWAIMVNQQLIFRLVTGNLTVELLLAWVLQGLVTYVAAGITISLIYKN